MLDQLPTEAQTNDPSPEELAKDFAEEIMEHENECQPILDRLPVWDELWRCRPTEVDGVPADSVYAKTARMEFFRCVETVHSNVLGALFGEQPWYQIAHDNIQNEGADADWDAVIEHQLREMPFHSKFDPILRDCAIQGTMVAGTPWMEKVRWNDAGTQYEREVIKDQPDIEPVDLLAFHRAPRAVDIEDADWVSEERDVSRGKLKEMMAVARLIPGAVVMDDAEINRMLDNAPDNIGNLNRRQEDVRRRRWYVNQAKDTRVHLDIRWGLHPGKEDSPIIWKFVTVNKRVCAIQHPNPFRQGFKPYLKCSYIPMRNSFYGLGLGALLELQQLELNTNAALLRNKFMLWVFGRYMQEGGQYNPDEKIPPEPGQILHALRYGKLTEIPVDLAPVSLMEGHQAGIKEDMRSSTIANAISQAQPTGGTAREVAELTSATLKRIQPIAGNIADNMVRPFLQRMLDLNIQQLPEATIAYVLGEDGNYRASAVLKSRLPGNPKPFVRLDTDLEFTSAIQRRLTATLQMIATARKEWPELDNEGFTAIPLIKKLVRSFGENPNEVFNEQIKQQRIAAKLAAVKAQVQTMGQAAAQAPAPGAPPAPPAVPGMVAPQVPEPVPGAAIQIPGGPQ